MPHAFVQSVINKEKSIALIGLGYVGLPIALEFAKKVKVIGFDINDERVAMMKNQIDPSGELDAIAFENTDIHFTSKQEDLLNANFFIVAVPTPIDSLNQPDLKPLLGASVAVGKALKKGDYVVFESTVYPGCTEEDCIPLLEKHSGLTYNKDFFVGYSPERINPGDKEHTLSKITKVVSGSNAETIDVVAGIYSLVVEAGVYKASSIKVAEAAKIIENTQRDLNIALMNELSIICDKLNVNTYEVLEAAGTKWNFLKFVPGLVGGHCIGVDPYYLTYKAKKVGLNPEVILAGRRINDAMGKHVAQKCVKLLSETTNLPIKQLSVGVFGATFKENVEDIRNSKVVDVIKELLDFGLSVEVVDPIADKKGFEHEYNLTIIDKPSKKYDAVVMAVAHAPFQNLNESDFKSLLKDQNSWLIDIKGSYRNKIKEINYWSL